MPSDITADLATVSDDPATLLGSAGERLLQTAYGTRRRAATFYRDQVCDRLLPTMAEFIGRMEMMFVCTADSGGACDASLRAGPPGFLRVLDDRHLAYPEYRGNGVHASLGNISENPHVGLLLIDFDHDLIGLHVNGRARIVDDEVIRTLHPELPFDPAPGRRAERWVIIEVIEAYVHCRKHIPRMKRIPEKRDWGTDDPARKGGDYFGARAERTTRPTTGETSTDRTSVEVPTQWPTSAREPAEQPPASSPSSSPGQHPGPEQPPGIESSGAVPVPPPSAPPQDQTDGERIPSITHLFTGAFTARPPRWPFRSLNRDRSRRIRRPSS